MSYLVQKPLLLPNCKSNVKLIIHTEAKWSFASLAIQHKHKKHKLLKKAARN